MTSLDWYNEEKTIILWKFQTNASIDDLIESFKAFNQMLDGVDRTVFTILVFPDVGKVPTGIVRRFPELARLLPKPRDAHGQVGVVSNHTFYKRLVEIFGNLYFSRFVFFTSLEAALSDFEQKLERIASE